MFTGLIETVGVLADRQQTSEDFKLRIESSLPHDELELGESIAVNGACLTVTEIHPRSFSAQASRETLRRTNLGELRAGGRVNLERALQIGQRLGGHLVLGHVDGVGALLETRREGNAVHLRIEAPPECAPLIVEKGSVTLDGISLTVNQLGDTTFEVTVVPWTAKHVMLLDRPRGWPINIEVDILGKYVARLLAHPAAGKTDPSPKREGISLDMLQRNGFFQDR